MGEGLFPGDTVKPLTQEDVSGGVGSYGQSFKGESEYDKNLVYGADQNGVRANNQRHQDKEVAYLAIVIIFALLFIYLFLKIFKKYQRKRDKLNDKPTLSNDVNKKIQKLQDDKIELLEEKIKKLEEEKSKKRFD